MTYTKAKQAELAQLHFHSKRHRYIYKGVVVPGVTTVIDQFLPYSTMPTEVLQEYRDRGTAVHEWTAWTDKPLDGTPVPPLDREYYGYAEAWQKFLDDTEFEIQAIEERVFHTRFLYAGTLDRVGVLRRSDTVLDGRLSVIDIKTGLLHREYALQTAAYMEAANEGLKRQPIDGRAAVQLFTDGTWKMAVYDKPYDFAAFCAALTMYNWKEATR